MSSRYVVAIERKHNVTLCEVSEFQETKFSLAAKSKNQACEEFTTNRELDLFESLFVRSQIQSANPLRRRGFA